MCSTGGVHGELLLCYHKKNSRDSSIHDNNERACCFWDGRYNFYCSHNLRPLFRVEDLS